MNHSKQDTTPFRRRFPRWPQRETAIAIHLDWICKGGAFTAKWNRQNGNKCNRIHVGFVNFPIISISSEIGSPIPPPSSLSCPVWVPSPCYEKLHHHKDVTRLYCFVSMINDKTFPYSFDILGSHTIGRQLAGWSLPKIPFPHPRGFSGSSLCGNKDIEPNCVNKICLRWLLGLRFCRLSLGAVAVTFGTSIGKSEMELWRSNATTNNDKSQYGRPRTASLEFWLVWNGENRKEPDSPTSATVVVVARYRLLALARDRKAERKVNESKYIQSSV